MTYRVCIEDYWVVDSVDKGCKSYQVPIPRVFAEVLAKAVDNVNFKKIEPCEDPLISSVIERVNICAQE
jgi:hypothetical protein